MGTQKMEYFILYKWVRESFIKEALLRNKRIPWQIHMFKSSIPIPQNVTSFGGRFFTKGIKLK